MTTTYRTIASREQHLGKRLHQLRNQLGLSDSTVAARYGLPVELLPRLEAGAAIPVPLVSNVRAALADLESQSSASAITIVDARSRPATPADEEPSMSTDAPGTGAPPSPVVSRKRVAPSLSDADRELIEQLRPERERRGLNLNQAATQIGIEWGSYRHLESGQVRVLRASARDKVRAWLDLSVIHEPADAEPDPALEQQIDEWQADQDGDEPADTDVIVKAYVFRVPLPDAPAAPAVTLADVLAYLPEFDSRWSDAVALRWFDAFDALAHLIATEALP